MIHEEDIARFEELARNVTSQLVEVTLLFRKIMEAQGPRIPYEDWAEALKVTRAARQSLEYEFSDFIDMLERLA